MHKRIKKTVLIVDDQKNICDIVKDRFTDCKNINNCPYDFEVDIVLSASKCVQKVRKKNYDVIVLDIRMEGSRSGLNAAFKLRHQLNENNCTPVRIIFTGHPSYQHCVEAMRYGVWDFIVKEDIDDTPMAQIVVNSALSRLQELDLRRELEQRIAGSWLPRNLRKLLPVYGGKLIAIWHRPEIQVIASGSDAFELEDNLQEWRKKHAIWEEPFIVEIPRQSPDQEEGD